MTELVNPRKHRQLFLDDHGIQSMSGLLRKLHQPKRKGPVLKANQLLHQTLVQSNSVPQWNTDKGIWEWWYSAFYDEAPYQGPGSSNWGDIHYSSSLDGFQWDNPSLGLYEWRGSKHNNLAYHSKVEYLRRRGQRNPVNIGERRLHHIIRDERDEDSQRRYKGLFSGGDNIRRYPAFSPDGFHWTFPNVDGIVSEDTSNMIYDDYNNRFVATVKQRTEWGRSVWMSTSDDFVDWTDPVLVLHTDHADEINGKERVRKAVEDTKYLSPPHIDANTDFIAQLYLMPLMPYEGQYIGFPLLFNPSGLDLPQMNHVGLNQTELAVSRDLYHWERVADREIFLGIEPWDGINYGTCQVAVCGRPIVRNDEIWVYFQACRFRGLPESYPPQYTKYFRDMGALELAKLRLDGFVSMDAKHEGFLVTKPFLLDGSVIYVNSESREGELRVEVIDADTMEALPELSFEDCHPVRTDDIRARVEWKRRLSLYIEKPVRLHFKMNKSKLYSYWTSD